MSFRVRDMSIASLSFANQVVTSVSASQSITVSNSGTAALAIGGIATTGDFGQTNNCGTTLAAGSSCNINVTFTPHCSRRSQRLVDDYRQLFDREPTNGKPEWDRY